MGSLGNYMENNPVSEQQPRCGMARHARVHEDLSNGLRQLGKRSACNAVLFLGSAYRGHACALDERIRHRYDRPSTVRWWKYRWGSGEGEKCGREVRPQILHYV